MPTTPAIRTLLLSAAVAVTAGPALADAAQDCRDATLTSEARQSACAAATREAASYEQRALAHLNAGHPEDALVAARRALEIADHLTRDSSAEAQTAPLRIEELGSWYEPAQGRLLEALVLTGAVDEAMAAYREAQAAGIEDTEGFLANSLAWGLYLEGKHNKALLIIEEWLSAHPEPMGAPEYHLALDTAAHLLAATEQTEEAVDTFLRAAEIGGPEQRILYKSQLTSLGFAPGEDEESFEAALRACAATGEACKLVPQ